MNLLLILSLAAQWKPRPIRGSTANDAVHSGDTVKPNIVVILADDLGWGNVGFHNEDNLQIATPNLDHLAETGLELHRMYVHSGCAPSRSSFQSGRVPVHVTTQSKDGISVPTHGVPPEMTGIAEKLKEANYKTYLIGKWDAGFARYSQLPIQKGYDHSFGYLGGNVGYFDGSSDDDCSTLDTVDLWEDDHPAFESVDAMTAHIATLESPFIEFMLRDKALDIIEEHAASDSEGPLFLSYCSHLPHSPSQIPGEYLMLDIYDNDEPFCREGTDYVFPGFDPKYIPCRTVLQSQVNLLDVIVGQIVDKLKATGLWEDTLLLVQSDNGGHIALTKAAGNNYPLRGGALSDFDGGIRAVTVLNGGFLPETRRGQREDGLMHIADWYVTWCSMLGLDHSDSRAVGSGLPDVDGFDLWPLISGEVTESPRTEVIVSEATFISGDLKFIRKSMDYALWADAVWPDADSSAVDIPVLDCDAPNYCLFNLTEDEGEYDNIAAVRPAITESLAARFEELSAGFYTNNRSGHNSCPINYRLTLEVEMEAAELPCGCWMALHHYNGFVGPYQDVAEQYNTLNGSSTLNYSTDSEADFERDGQWMMRSEMDKRNQIELEWIEKYQETFGHGMSGLVDGEDSLLGPLRPTVDVEHQDHRDGVLIEIAHENRRNGYSDGGLTAPKTVYIGVATTVSVCSIFVCVLARCLRAKDERSLMDLSDSYGTNEERYIL